MYGRPTKEWPIAPTRPNNNLIADEARWTKGQAAPQAGPCAKTISNTCAT